MGGVPVSISGPHFFHTENKNLLDFLSPYGEMIPYQNRVVSLVKEGYVTVPVNFSTISSVGINPDKVIGRLKGSFIKDQRVPLSRLLMDTTIREEILHLQKILYVGYTEKQWGMPFHKVPCGVLDRVPFVIGKEDMYFGDSYQVIPKLGYSQMITNMLMDSRAEVRLGEAFSWEKHHPLAKRVIFCGEVDSLFNKDLGSLPYLSTHFDISYRKESSEYPLVNYPSKEVPYTRETNYSRVYNAKGSFSWVVKETPLGNIGQNPMYPVVTSESSHLHKQYQARVQDLQKVTLLGRLGLFRYLNMDQAMEASLSLAESLEG
jgi:UDP-galactopyranose mutase